MEEFYLMCQSPAELLSCRKTLAVQQGVSTPTHCYSKARLLATQRLCHKNLITTTTTPRTLTPSTEEALTSTLALIAATTTATATTTVRTTATETTTITSTTTGTTTSSSLSGSNKQIPIRRIRSLPPASAASARTSSINKQDFKQRQQQEQHLIQKLRNLWSCLYWRHNLTCIMMATLLLVSILLSGNTVLAAQRESSKPKDTNNLNNNANAIYNEISSSGSDSSSSGNGNAISHNNNNNNNNISNGYVNITTTMSLTTKAFTSTSSSSSSSSSGYATTTTTHTTSSTTSSSGSGNSGSHKTSSSSNRNSIESQDTTQNGPYFDKAASKNITALLGKTAYLNCRVKNLGNKTMLLQVSWVRHRDIHLLTVGRYTYTSDQRFRAIHQPQTEDWILQIKYPQHRDSGIYECQVSTTPHMSHYIHLTVVEPSTQIIGAPDLYIESGSTINLTCVILNSPEPPAYIFWNHNNAIINYDSPRGGVSVVTNKGETTTSFLLIKSARPSDSGHYQCNPSNAKPKSVTVHVLNGVSHSVSRGIPSSNAARGTSTSSTLSKSLYLSVPVNVLVYLSICQALHKPTGCSDWSKICAHVIETCVQLLGLLLPTLMAGFVKMLRRRNRSKTTCNIANSDSKDKRDTNTICCYEMQLHENYHMTCTASKTTPANSSSSRSINYPLTTTIVKSTCRHQSLSTKFATQSLTLHCGVVVIVNICSYLLYSKSYNNLYKNTESTLTASSSSTKLLSTSSSLSSTLESASSPSRAITVPLTILSATTVSTVIDDNCSDTSYCFTPCYALRLCLQSATTATITTLIATYFSESDIR